MNKLVINEGFAKWPIGTLFGGDNDDTSQNKNEDSQNKGSSGNGNSNSGGNQNSGSGNSNSNSSSQDDEEDEDDDDTPYGNMSAKELRRELERANKDGKKTAADLETAQTALKEKERAEMDEIDKYKADLKAVTEERDDLARSFESQVILNQILLNKDYEFHDANDVTFFINRKELKIDTKTGEVDGLKEELKRVAKDKPHLVLKSKVKNDDNKNNNGNQNNNGDQQNRQNGASGFQPGQGGGNGNSDKDVRSGLTKKYSSLANR